MSNLLVEIGNTALKAAWSDRMTLGNTFLRRSATIGGSSS